MKKSMIRVFGAVAILSAVTMGCAADGNDAAGNISADTSSGGSDANEGNFISGKVEEWKVSVAPNTATAG